MRKERKNEALLWFGKWTSKLGNIVFDYANSVSIIGAFSHAPWVLALYQSSETVIQIVFNLIGGAKADSGSRKKDPHRHGRFFRGHMPCGELLRRLAAHGGGRHRGERSACRCVRLQLSDVPLHRP